MLISFTETKTWVASKAGGNTTDKFTDELVVRSKTTTGTTALPTETSKLEDVMPAGKLS